MELAFPPFQILFTFILFMLMVLKLLNHSKHKNLTRNLPPGPRKRPLIGNTHHLAGSLPHQFLRNLAEQYGPLMHLQLRELSMVMVSSPETAKEVMKTHDVNFANRPYLLPATVVSYDATNLIFAPYGEYWRRLRKIYTLELLSTKRFQSFSLVREEVLKLIKSISSHAGIGSPVNLGKSNFSLMYGITAMAAFGKKCKDQEAFISLVKEASAAAGGFNLADLYPSSKVLPLLSGIRIRLEKIHHGFDQILDNIIQEHMVGDGDADDLVNLLLKVKENGGLEVSLTMNSIKAVILMEQNIEDLDMTEAFGASVRRISNLNVGYSNP